jgi:hypothetical protein
MARLIPGGTEQVSGCQHAGRGKRHTVVYCESANARITTLPRNRLSDIG